MLKPKFFPLLVLPAGVVLLVNAAVLHYPASHWTEPRLVIIHTIIVFILTIVLSMRVGMLAVLTGALAFGLFPSHAYAWLEGQRYLWGWGLYIVVFVAAIALAAAFDRFYAFLKTQEALVRGLFIVGVGAMLGGMALMTVWANEVWKSEEGVWLYRTKHAPRPHAFNEWARLMYQKSGNTTDAVDAYKKSLKLDPKNKEALFALGHLYEETARPADVIGIYNELQKCYPEDEEVYKGIIEGYGRAFAAHPDESIYKEKREEVLAAYEQMSKRKTYTANDYFNLGFLYEQVGGYEEAMRFYRKALAVNPTHEKSLYNLANRYQENGDVKTAIALYTRLVRANPKSTLAMLNMGLIYNAMGNTDKAKYFYQRVISIDPDNADAYFNLGYMNETAGELREALNYYEKSVEKNPRHAEAYYNMGNTYATLNQYPEAIASYIKTVTINPNHQNAFVNLSILSFKSKDFQGAIRYLEQAQILGYTPPEAYLKTLEPYRKK